MSVLAAGTTTPGVLVVAFILIIACALGVVATLWDWGWRATETTRRARTWAILEREKDLAAGLGLPWQRWVGARVAVTLIGFIFAVISHIALLVVVAPVAAYVGLGFAFGGRAANRRLKMERAFLGQLRNIRDRMAVSNQSLDTALQEVGRNPGRELEYVLAPLARSGSVVANIVETGRRSRSPVVEYACGVLLWARSRNMDSLIAAIDEIVIPVGEAQLAVQEETLVTLAQQRAVTFAMAFLMMFMFFVVIRVDIFSQYYQSTSGNATLALVIAMFAFLVWTLGKIVSIGGWTRWNLVALAHEQEHLGA